MDWITSWYNGLQKTMPVDDTVLTETYRSEITFLAQLLLSVTQEKQNAILQVQALFQQHPDQAIFVSLPGASDLLQPQLLVMFGEDRDRFPSPQAIRALAGTCLVTSRVVRNDVCTFGVPAIMTLATRPISLPCPLLPRLIGRLPISPTSWLTAIPRKKYIVAWPIAGCASS
jgi:hypothetical protein